MVDEPSHRDSSPTARVAAGPTKDGFSRPHRSSTFTSSTHSRPPAQCRTLHASTPHERSTLRTVRDHRTHPRLKSGLETGATTPLRSTDNRPLQPGYICHYTSRPRIAFIMGHPFNRPTFLHRPMVHASNNPVCPHAVRGATTQHVHPTRISDTL